MLLIYIIVTGCGNDTNFYRQSLRVVTKNIINVNNIYFQHSSENH